mgnify:CR=1 FL=1
MALTLYVCPETEIQSLPHLLQAAHVLSVCKEGESEGNKQFVFELSQDKGSALLLATRHPDGCVCIAVDGIP